MTGPAKYLHDRIKSFDLAKLTWFFQISPLTFGKRISNVFTLVVRSHGRRMVHINALCSLSIS